MNDHISFDELDGLVLATISYNKNCDVVSWILFIDFYYRIIISFNELTSALDKLQKSGLIRYEENTLQCTERAKKILAGRNKSGLLNWIFKVQRKIVQQPFEDAFDVRFNISLSEYENQLKEYRLLKWSTNE